MSLFRERFFRQKIGKVLCPVHLKWRLVLPYPVLLRTAPVEPRALSPWFLIDALAGRHPGQRSRLLTAGVGFPKTTTPFGIAGIHDFKQGTLFDFKRLDKGQAFNTSIYLYK
jgi:hypothetical protein